MLYFIEMQRVQGTPINNTDNEYVKPTSDLNSIYFAVTYLPDIEPSGFGYRVYFRQVDSRGDCIEDSIMYGLGGVSRDTLSSNSVHVISVVLHKLIAVKTGMRFNYTGLSVADSRFSNIENWARIFLGYTRYYPINVQLLDQFYVSEYWASRVGIASSNASAHLDAESAGASEIFAVNQVDQVNPINPINPINQINQIVTTEVSADTPNEDDTVVEPFDVDSFFAVEMGEPTVIEQPLTEVQPPAGVQDSDQEVLGMLSECLADEMVDFESRS